MRKIWVLSIFILLSIFISYSNLIKKCVSEERGSNLGEIREKEGRKEGDGSTSITVFGVNMPLVNIKKRV